MINGDIINNIIDELESEDSLFDICQQLAAFYIIQDHMQKDKSSEVVAEYSDILPEYHKYVEIKKRFQQKQLTESAVLLSMQNVCSEIKQFIRTLYSSTDMPEEREQIKSMLVNLANSI